MTKTWKAIERKVAKWFGSERTPLSGGNSKQTRSDSLHDILYIEVKYRVRHSAVALWRDTAAKANRENKIPVCCLCERGKEGFWLVIHSEDLLEVSNQRLVIERSEKPQVKRSLVE